MAIVEAKWDTMTDVISMIGDEGQWINRRIFCDEAIYREELERIFRRCWLFVAHESQIPETGDFVSTYMGEDCVLVVRQQDGSIRVVINSCPHRGNRVCHAEAGKARSFICNYHGWSFGRDGRFLGAHEQAAYDATRGFSEDREKLGMFSAPKVESYKGLVFATFDQNAPTLQEYLGDFCWYLDALLDNDEGGTEFLPGSYKYMVASNWKTPVENTSGDALHAGWAHASGAEALFGRGIAPGAAKNSYHVNVNGHCWQFNLDFPLGNAAAIGDRKVLDYLRERNGRVVERLGEFRAKIMNSISSVLVFPNLGILPGSMNFRVYHPRGPNDLEVHSWGLVNRNAPAEIKEGYRKGGMMTFGPAGLFELDDGENWEFANRTSRGQQARQMPLYLGVGMGTETEDSPCPGNVNVHRGHMNEANQRAFFRRWAHVMMAESWDQLTQR
jgi:ethylbenzene dioxygenase alpha subunit